MAEAGYSHIDGAEALVAVVGESPGEAVPPWGTVASAKVNAHVSLGEDMRPWQSVCQGVMTNSILDVIHAVSRKRVEEMYGREI